MFGLKEKHIEALHGCFSLFETIERVIIYGSRAKGNFKPGSDIDLTIVGDLPYSQLLKLENQLDDLLLPYKIDLSLLHQISNRDLIEHIERVGKVLYDRERKIAFHEPPIDYKKDE